MKKIVAPTHCPVCSCELSQKNNIIYCENHNCPARNVKALEHWAKVVKIKGLGPQTIEKLNIYSLEDLYALSEDDIKIAIGSSKLAKKLFLELENSKLAPLNVTLPGFCIPFCGQSATQKLAKVISRLEQLTEEKALEAGLGPVVRNNLLSWVKNTYMFQYKYTLPLNFNFETVKEPELKKGVICITGKLKSFKTKAEAASALQNKGYKVVSTVTKEVTILVNESGIESAKTQKARESGVLVINSITELI